MEKIIDGIAVEIVRKNIKNMHLYVKKDGSVRVSAPRFIPIGEIERFVRQKHSWIVKSMNRAAAMPPPLGYSDGETLCLWGREYTLTTAAGETPSLSFSYGDAVLMTPVGASSEQRRMTVREEYRKQLIIRAESCVSKWERATDLHPTELRTKFMKTRWGTCNTAVGRIWLNPHLAWFNESCLDYVALHEIIHLKIHGHGSDFYSLLGQYMPDYREREKQLKASSPNILI